MQHDNKQSKPGRERQIRESTLKWFAASGHHGAFNLQKLIAHISSSLAAENRSSGAWSSIFDNNSAMGVRAWAKEEKSDNLEDHTFYKEAIDIQRNLMKRLADAFPDTDSYKGVLLSDVHEDVEKRIPNLQKVVGMLKESQAWIFETESLAAKRNDSDRLVEIITEKREAQQQRKWVEERLDDVEHRRKWRRTG